MKALLVVVIALLLFVGAIGTVLKMTASTPTTKSNDVPGLGDPVRGRQVALRPDVSCVTCHSDDGSRITAPTFKGMWGSIVTYDDGSSELMDDKAIRWTLKHPNEKIVDSYEPRMPNDIDTKLTEEDRVNLLAYLRSIGKGKN